MIVVKEEMAGTIPELIRSTRKEKGLTLKELASLSGHSPSALSRWETGSRSMTVEDFVALMGCMGVKVLVR